MSILSRIFDRDEDRRDFERDAAPELQTLSHVISGGFDSLLVMSYDDIRALDPITLAIVVKVLLFVLKWYMDRKTRGSSHGENL